MKNNWIGVGTFLQSAIYYYNVIERDSDHEGICHLAVICATFVFDSREKLTFAKIP